MPNILAIETATDGCSCAVLAGKQTFACFEIAPRRHAEIILSMVDDVLRQAELSLPRLDAIAFGCGPGSFMGVRLATGVAKGLGFAANLPLIPVSSLQALAQHAYAKLKRSHIAAAWDARMGEVYWGAYVHDQNGVMQPLTQDHLSQPSDIALPAGQPWVLVGNAWEVYQEQLPPTLQLESHLFYPRASAMLVSASSMLKQGDGEDPLIAHPNYLRMQVAYKKST